MAVIEHVCGKTLVWECDVWCASFALQEQKTYREKRTVQALEGPRVPDTYIQFFALVMSIQKKYEQFEVTTLCLTPCLE